MSQTVPKDLEAAQAQLSHIFLRMQYMYAVEERLADDPAAAAWKGFAGEIFDSFALMVDPTAEDLEKPHRYLAWLCRCYTTEKPPLPSVKEIREALVLFEKRRTAKRSGPELDIEAFTLKDLVRDLRDFRANGYWKDPAQVKQLDKFWKHKPAWVREQTVVLSLDQAGVVLIPCSFRAASYWAEDTRWMHPKFADGGGNRFYNYDLRKPPVVLNPAGTDRWYLGGNDMALINEKYHLAVVTEGLERLLNQAPRGFLNLSVNLNNPRYSGAADWSNRDYALAQVSRDGGYLANAPPSVCADWDVALTALKESTFFVAKYVDPRFWKREDFVKEAIRQNIKFFVFADPSLRARKDIVMMLFERGCVSSVFRSIDPALRADREVVLKVVSEWGGNLENVDPALQADREIVLAAVRSFASALQYASPALRADREIVLAAVKRWGDALKYADPALQDDYEIVLAAVTSYGNSLKRAGPRMKENRDILLAAVSNGAALMDCGIGIDTALFDREIVLAALEKNRFMSEGPVLRQWADDREVMLAAVKCVAANLEFASPALKADRDIVLAAVKQCGSALEYADPALRADWEIVLTALKSGGGALKYVAPSLQADRVVVRAAVESWGEALRYASPELRADRDIVLAAVRQTGFALQYAAPAFRKDRGIALTAVTTTYDEALWEAIDPAFRADPEFMLKAVLAHRWALKHAAPSLLNDSKFLRQCALRDVRLLLTRFVNDDSRFSQDEIRTSFKLSLARDWRVVALADDCGVKLSVAQQKELFDRARAEMGDEVDRVFYCFPVLREAVGETQGTLTLEEALAIFEKSLASCAPAPVRNGPQP